MKLWKSNGTASESKPYCETDSFAVSQYPVGSTAPTSAWWHSASRQMACAPDWILS